MKKPPCLLLMSASLCVVPAQSNGRVLVIRGATLVDVKSGKEIPETVIVRRGERVGQVGTEGKIAIPAGARTVDVKGKWVIPGLIDSRAHAESAEETPFGLYLANGVTAIRNPGGNTTVPRLTRENLLKGEIRR